ncbi:molybdopterin synthase catalytic subunit [Octopus bimaculoides]|uniref:Molybdopterin synthase catalytic subunit n=1 Tax=Octopus bimaculoides TaxID=37653 RepID=A0A0L8GRS7_OCTBM|nr:molybdopterin synthase catalytic subunit [Octopus bimaculoides]XP_014778700.1 molybdopterin synthase catalytic subunit [Octopus bimaculoides]|eukprot:XP_014778699.1 PREDICTED: molybdopterin synthase catalytic subunit-like [Octopus bimaculoides]
MTDIVELSNEKLNIEGISKSVTLPNCGAVSLFIGTTRDHFDGKEVLSLQYEAYCPMAKKKMFEICQDIRSKWNVGKIALVHRLGEVPVAEASVVIAISSEHRKESLEAVQYAINTLKAVVPIWKKELYRNSSPEWKENAECFWKKEGC